MIYKAVGIRPTVVKLVQLAMLCLIAALMPVLGMQLYGRTGVASGFVAGLVYLMLCHEMATQLMTESLISIFILLLVFCSLPYLKHPTWGNSLLLGTVLGLSLLVKGSLIFIPPFLLMFTGLRAWITKEKKYLVGMAGVMIPLTLIVFLWSSYATRTSNSFILLSTQGEVLLLDAHNEHTWYGDWQPQHRKDLRRHALYFHNQPALEGKSSLQKVIAFYQSRPQQLLPSMYHKLQS